MMEEKHNVLYPNLEAELGRLRMSRRKLAESTGIPYSTLRDKLAGRTQVTLGDAKLIQRALNSKDTVDYLFFTLLYEI